jgi:hypothetical protein
MKQKLKISVILGSIALFLIGCGETQPSFDASKQSLGHFQKHVITVRDKYYMVPVISLGSRLDAKWAYINRVTSSGLLECKKDDVYALHSSFRSEDEKINKAYLDSLTPEELKTLSKHPTIIPQKDSKEFGAIVAYETKLVREGKMACIAPMTKQQVKEYKAYKKQQDKINNDPKVIAARIQANTQLQQARMEKDARDKEAAFQSIQNLNNQLANMTPKTYNVNVMHY